ncbi:MAG TPA: DegT/DnrJ/EryC1/StrS aminotransferase family protein [Pyrinomonadaceae bacterium]|jgi:dTDP-4-amino-4,6-dideoxygalactose transaminase|nr:DegT/DnrJ/EryC1/StrS aminotransferase family protein [Pyrinomonadaceae bacterium]
MRDTFLPFSPPLIGEEEIAEVVDTLRSDWITTGPKARRFEEEFARYVGAPAALGLNSCTAALHTALAALGVGAGDAVVTTPMTFVSSVHVIEHVGARPLLADVEPDTLNVDPRRVAEAIESARAEGLRVRALLPVHLYGHPCDMNALMDLAREYGLAVVEDAAHALPASHEGRRVGSFASLFDVPVLTCFSFYATKNLTTGEGGMLTGPPELIDEARVWSLHGMSRDAWNRYGAKGSWFYEVVRPGFKYNLTDIAAALGLAQLRKLDGFQARRAEIARRYNGAFSRFEELELPAEREGVEHAWHLYVLRLNLERLRVTRDQFIEEMRERRIGTSVHFIPVHTHPYYRDRYGFRAEDFPVAHAEFRRVVSLPLNPRMSDRDADDVIEAVADVTNKFRR